MFEKLPSLTGGWLVDELLEELDEELDEELLEDGLLLLELEELLLLELELDELVGLFDSLDTDALDSESDEAGNEVLSTVLLDSLLT